MSFSGTELLEEVMRTLSSLLPNMKYSNRWNYDDMALALNDYFFSLMHRCPVAVRHIGEVA